MTQSRYLSPHDTSSTLLSTHVQYLPGILCDCEPMLAEEASSETQLNPTIIPICPGIEDGSLLWQIVIHFSFAHITTLAIGSLELTVVLEPPGCLLCNALTSHLHCDLSFLVFQIKVWRIRLILTSVLVHCGPDLSGLDLCPESSRWTCRCPQHIQPRKEKDLEEDASFHRPAPVMSEDED
ncbi:hypothetical protein CAPTEDRAFT_203615 [Capitella teleta]|uniref:Uncharacterized protein n=1 Tax=Capitella teleta TaxID=283909 RepID=R7TEH3_CAPTE|nr:hypothetical protein CAPTEDRAFT_203615 [Capitella teleta]|eukprot:ELT89466.1 hypothetical protein CAPTEDRAFT_203615 [Capitella teleta]